MAKKSVSPVMHACVYMLSYVVINLILAIIVYVYFLCKCLTLNCRMFNLNVIHLDAILMVFFQIKFPFKDNDVLSYIHDCITTDTRADTWVSLLLRLLDYPKRKTATQIGCWGLI